MTTKEKILYEALRLFSEKGYSEVFVADIAAAVGIKAPSLYKHYKNKQEIFDSCVESFSERMLQMRTRLLLPETRHSSLSYQTADQETIIGFATGLFLFYLKDEVASRFRKMLMMERYRNPQLNQLFEKIFIFGAVDHEEQIFEQLSAAGVLKQEDQHLLALRFYTPIFYLLQKYDLYPEKEEEALLELQAIVREFCETYKG